MYKTLSNALTTRSNDAASFANSFVFLWQRRVVTRMEGRGKAIPSVTVVTVD